MLLAACTFASNHVSARFAFDDQTGLLLTILIRAGLCLLALLGIVLWQRQSLRLPASSIGWQIAVGMLLATQSLSLFSAVARIPVAIALLLSNTFPVMLALLTWALGGSRPTRQACLLMGTLIVGWLLVLNIPDQLAGRIDLGPHWRTGVVCALLAAAVFSGAIWITEHKLSNMAGTVRSFYTVSIIFVSILITGIAGVIPGGLDTPASSQGWIAVGMVALMYTAGFSTLFVLVPRLDMARNAPIMNAEPVFSLILGWLLLGQILAPIQLVGGAIVLSCIVALAYQRKT